MARYYISINQLAVFTAATDSAKKRIISQQKVPNKLLIPWYQRAKGAMKKYFSNTKDFTPIDNAITILKARTSTKKWQKTDKEVSIQALELLKEIRLPKILEHLKYDVIVPDEKSLLINNVDIIVAPEIIIKAEYKGTIIYGAIKIHISKGKPFNLNQSTYVATTIYQLLSKRIAKKDEKVLPELCLCLDVFSQRLTPAPSKIASELSAIKTYCNEIKALWTSS